MRRTMLAGLVLLGFSPPAVAERPTRTIVFDGATTSSSTRAQTRTVYLNRGGVTLVPGSNDSRTNKSSIIASPATIPAWNASPALWTQTVACLRQMFAPFDVAITETDPGATVQHIEAVFGGRPSNVGMSANVSGVSPFSSTCKVIENSIVFTFTEVIPQNAKVACEIMAQEIAHSYGLDHELLAADPMTYLSYSGERSFQNVMADCGESSPRACGISEATSCRAKQNSYALLLERIGAAGTGDIDPPVVNITSPSGGAMVDPGFTITATATDDVIVKYAALYIDGEPAGTLSQAPWSFTAPADLAAGRHTIEVKASDGKHEQTAMLDVVVRGGDGDAPSFDPNPIGGCSTTKHPAWLLVLLAIWAITRRRAQR